MNHADMIEELYCSTITGGIRSDIPLFMQYHKLGESWRKLAAKMKSQENCNLRDDIVKQWMMYE